MACFVENSDRKQRKQQQKGVFPAPNCQFFQIHGSKLKLDPSGDCGQASVVRITHCVLFFCVSKHSLNGLLAHRVNAFRIFCFSDTLYSIQIGLPDVSRQELLPFLICSTFRFVRAVPAILWRAAVTALSVLVGGGLLRLSENRQNQQNPAGKFSILLRRFFRPKPKKAANPPEKGSLTACFLPKSLPKPPDSGGDSNGKSLRSAGFKTSISDDTTIKNWPTVKSANQCGARYRTRTCDLLHVKQMLYQLS